MTLQVKEQLDLDPFKKVIAVLEKQVTCNADVHRLVFDRFEKHDDMVAEHWANSSSHNYSRYLHEVALLRTQHKCFDFLWALRLTFF